MSTSQEIKTFLDFQNDLQNYVKNYIDKSHKDKFFKINKRIYAKMFTCFENVRQTNEKIEECVKKEENEKSNWMKEMTKIYSINLKKLEICSEKCKSEEDLDCLITCGEIFKKEYNIDMEKSMCNQYNKYISTSPSL